MIFDADIRHNSPYCVYEQVVVGGGPTGIEVAGELHDFLEAYFPSTIYLATIDKRYRKILNHGIQNYTPMCI